MTDTLNRTVPVGEQFSLSFNYLNADRSPVNAVGGVFTMMIHESRDYTSVTATLTGSWDPPTGLVTFSVGAAVTSGWLWRARAYKVTYKPPGVTEPVRLFEGLLTTDRGPHVAPNRR
jgi:hypothetical protein